MPLRFIKDSASFAAPGATISDSLDWEQFAENVPFAISGHASFHCVTDISALGCDIFIRNGHLTRRTQDGGPSWVGCFNASDALLFTDYTPGPLQFTFERPIRGAGAQIDINDIVQHTTVSISAFAGALRLPLPESGTRTDVSFNSKGDGSAPFVGVLETGATSSRITRIVFALSVLDPSYRGDASFAINKLKLII